MQPPRGLLTEACRGGGQGVSSGTDWGLGPEQIDDVSNDSITPELAALPPSAGPPKLFPVFRRKAEWKVRERERGRETEKERKPEEFDEV